MTDYNIQDILPPILQPKSTKLYISPYLQSLRNGQNPYIHQKVKKALS